MSTIRVNDDEIIELKSLSYLHKSSKYSDLEYLDSPENREKLCFTSKKARSRDSVSNTRNIVKYWESKHYTTGDVFYTVFYDTGTVMYVKEGSSVPILSVAYPVNAEKSYAEDFFELILNLPESIVNEEQKTYRLVGSFHYSREVIDYIIDHESLSKPTKLAALFSFVGIGSSSSLVMDLESVKRFIANQHPIENTKITKIHDLDSYKNPGFIKFTNNHIQSIKYTSQWTRTPKVDRPKLLADSLETANKIALFMTLYRGEDKLQEIERIDDPITLLKDTPVQEDRYAYFVTISTVSELYLRYKLLSDDTLLKELLSLSKNQLLHLSFIGLRNFNDNDRLIFNALKKSKLEFTKEVNECKKFESKCVKDFGVMSDILTSDELSSIDDVFNEIFSGSIVSLDSKDLIYYISTAYQNTSRDKFIEIVRNLDSREIENYSFYYGTIGDNKKYISVEIDERIINLYKKETLEGIDFFDFDFDMPFSWVLATKGVDGL